MESRAPLRRSTPACGGALDDGVGGFDTVGLRPTCSTDQVLGELYVG